MGPEETGAALTAVAERVGPAVVGLGAGWGRGSGVVVAPGRVLTVAHALRGAEPTLTLGDGRRVSGRVLAADPDRDLAVLEADTGEARPVEWHPEEAGPTIGRPVVALADPGGSGLRVTPGFVASVGRRFRGPRGRWIRDAIEHTAPLPRGSAGGPLVDLAGRLLGVNTVRVEGGLILAAPADADLAERVERLGRGEAPSTRQLGVAVAPPRAARRMRRAVGLPERDGLLVRQVEEGGPAGRAGLAPGDLIVAAAGRPVDGAESVHSVLDALGDGEELVLRVLRGADEREVRVTFEAAAGR